MESPPEMSVDEFLDICGEQLSARDFRILKRLLESTPDTVGGSAFANAWRDKETQLRNAIVKIRAARLQVNAEPFLKDTEETATDATRAAEEAFNKKSPLDREMALDHFRWQQIEELAGFDPFTAKAVFAYGLKFKLAKRWSDMGREQGEKLTEDLLNNKTDSNPDNNEHTHTEQA